MKLTKSLTILSISFILASSLLISGCNSGSSEVDGLAIDTIDKNETKTLTSFNIDNKADISSVALPLENEIKGLSLILNPRFDPIDSNYIGDENKDYLQRILLKPVNTKEPLPASDWEKIIKILFSSEDKNDLDINSSAFSDNGLIERQFAITTLMELLPKKYSSFVNETDYDSVKKSDGITDLNSIDEKHQILVRQAYCLGFTDFTVDSSRLFRPEEPLNSGEAISILYRTLTNLGLPVSDTKDASIVETLPAVMFGSSQTLSQKQADSYTFESFQQEYSDYLGYLKKNNSAENQKKLKQLDQTEIIVDINDDNFGDVISMEQWREILYTVFEIKSEQITSYLAFETCGALPYDIASISIFKLPEIYGAYETKDVTEEELKEARDKIPQFDTARDTGKFARMFSSGLLDGIYQIPGFTPQRPLNKAETLLIVKRLIRYAKPE